MDKKNAQDAGPETEFISESVKKIEKETKKEVASICIEKDATTGNVITRYAVSFVSI